MSKEYSFIKIEQGYILPHKDSDNRTYGLGGVLRQDGSFVEESAFILPMNQGGIADWGGQYSFDQSGCEICDRDVIFAGFINNNEWGHFIDCGTRYFMMISQILYFVAEWILNFTGI